MLTNCERCHEERECLFYGRPFDADDSHPAASVHAGLWLCGPCAPAMNDELDAAIARLEDALDDEDEEDD